MAEVHFYIPVPHKVQELVFVKKDPVIHNVASTFDVQVLALVPQAEQTPSFIKKPFEQVVGTGPIQVMALSEHLKH